MLIRIAAAAALLAFAAACTTPEPIAQRELVERSEMVKRATRPVEVPVDRPLGFADAVARGLAQNLDIRLAALEAVIARGAVDLADLGKLPQLVQSAGYFERTPAGQATDKDPTDPQRTTRSTDLSWNVLDFGVAYVRAQQAANEALAADERRRRMANAIVNELRFAYWTAALGARRLPEIAAIMKEIEAAMERSKKLVDARLQDPVVALAYQDGLLELRRQARSYEMEVAQARARLARLLNAHPSTDFKLVAAAPDETFRALGALPRDTLEDVALVMRPEVRESEYAARNRDLDVINAYVQGLPSFKLRVTQFYDSTTAVAEPRWREEGWNFSWNVLSVLSTVQRASLARQGTALVEIRRLALALGVMEQVGLSREQLELSDDDYALAKEASRVRRGIYEIRRDRVPFGEMDELERIRAAVSAVLAQIREDKAYATLQRSYGDLLAAVGVDQFPEHLDLSSPDAAKAIERHMATLPATVRELAQQIAALRGSAKP